MASIEDILMYKLQEDAANAPSQGMAIATGAALGAVPGFATGRMLHRAGNNVNKLLNRTPVPGPGYRMAGGLVGAILGGALGSGVRNMVVNQSPAAALLAKGKSGNLTEGDMQQLEQVLLESYQQMGLS